MKKVVLSVVGVRVGLPLLAAVLWGMGAGTHPWAEGTAALPAAVQAPAP
jgi:hypothetical protein